MANIYKQKLAEQDLINIWVYSYHQWGQTQADKYIDELEQAINTIASSPYTYRERTEFSPAVRICHHANHLIIYTISSHDINIIRVLHKSMDMNRQLEP